MRGADSVADDQIYEGTAKSAEGYLAAVLFRKAHEEGCKILVNWQDQDSSAEKSFREVFGDTSSRVMKCGGHIGRAHGNALKEMKSKKSLTVAYKRKHVNDFPEVEYVSCSCSGKKHKVGCGCITDSFIQGAKRNLYCAITQAKNSAEDFAKRMRNLGRYHARGIHEWEEGKCDFHPLVVCSCGKCSSPEELKCKGKAYTSKNVLRCELHALVYEIECYHRANQASEVIDPDLGRGHSNLCESTFSVLTKFRPKDTNLHRMHYQTSTNLGLIQSNMSYLYKKRGSTYHWALDLYKRIGLPELEGMREICQQDNKRRMKSLENKKAEHVKTARVAHKCKRADEQQKRKAWVKRQRIVHSYGMINDDEDEDDVEYVDPAELRQGLEEIIASGNNNPPDTSSPLPRLPDNVIVNIGGQGCKKCGSTTHKRSNHKDCPYNKQRQNFVSPTTCQSSKACKKCGGQDHQRSNHKIVLTGKRARL